MESNDESQPDRFDENESWPVRRYAHIRFTVLPHSYMAFAVKKVYISSNTIN
jgi:hypothetical protein